MKNSAHFCFAVLALSAAVSTQAARPVELPLAASITMRHIANTKKMVVA